MKKIFNQQLLSLLCLFLITAAGISCKKDKTTDAGIVELLSFGPSGVKHGEKISFIGKHLDKVTAIELAGATVAAAAFVEQSAELIVITVPSETEKGPVTLKVPEGDIVSKTPLNLEVVVTIISIPATTHVGETITIKGENMNWITGMWFSNDIAVTEFVSQSVTELVVKVPADAVTGTLSFAVGGTEPVTVETEEELVVQ
ncbi:hypothetical protein [Chitinophaga sp. MM2321]|uniref:hypothetical protein n=1 Tax=Chitinophaga sp. MM2321 TaxID=3137178 RepID=UPI0032D58E11